MSDTSAAAAEPAFLWHRTKVTLVLIVTGGALDAESTCGVMFRAVVSPMVGFTSDNDKVNCPACITKKSEWPRKGD